MNGDIEDHSHMNALPLHSNLNDTFLQSIFFFLFFLLKFVCKIPKRREICIMHKPVQVLDLLNVSGGGASVNVVLPVVSLFPSVNGLSKLTWCCWEI